jgi:periplasmic protein TonB
LYALEDEPESQHRWRRLGMGALITASVLAALGYGAQRFEPTRRLIQKVVQMTVVTELPKPEKLPPPRTEPLPPPPKRSTPQKSNTPAAAQAKQPQPQQQSAEPVVGLEDGSFGGGAGPSFQVGTTQLGDPVNVARAPVTAAVAPVAPARMVPAGLPERVERCRYHTRAQRLGLQGLMVIETEIDEDGRVTQTKLRKGLEAELDQECLEAVRSARFQPATLGGKPIASTRLLRLRFELDR